MQRTEESSKADILDRVEKRAYELLDRYHGCAQRSLLAIQEVCELSKMLQYSMLSDQTLDAMTLKTGRVK